MTRAEVLARLVALLSSPIADGLPPAEEVERAYVIVVLEHTSGNMSHAARILGIDRRTLYRKLEVFAIDARSFRAVQEGT